MLGAVALAASACGTTVVAPTPAPVTLRVAATQEALPLLRELAETYARRQPGLMIETVSLDATQAADRLRKGEIALAFLPRRLAGAPAEGVSQAEAARFPIALIVHPQNTLKSISLSQLRELYSGGASEWDQIGGPVVPVMVLSREPGAAARERFDTVGLGASRLSPSALMLPSDEAMALTVSRRPEAIGYILGMAAPPGTRLVSVDGKSAASLAHGSDYPLWQPVIMATPAGAPALVAGLAGFVLGNQGQRIITTSGYGKGGDGR